jgi:hypothetical protein
MCFSRFEFMMAKLIDLSTPAINEQESEEAVMD